MFFVFFKRTNTIVLLIVFSHYQKSENFNLKNVNSGGAMLIRPQQELFESQCTNQNPLKSSSGEASRTIVYLNDCIRKIGLFANVIH